MALVALDRQHAGKPGNWTDPGAWYDLDGDGSTEVHEAEARLTRYYMAAAEDRLVELGHAVVVLSDGTYAERHNRINAYKAKITVACHLNAGKGLHGLVIHDSRSVTGQKVAAAMAPKLAANCPELSKVIVGDTVSYPRALGCISGLYSGVGCGIVFEPCFVDQAAHVKLLTPEGLRRIGLGLAEGIHAALGG